QSRPAGSWVLCVWLKKQHVTGPSSPSGAVTPQGPRLGIVHKEGFEGEKLDMQRPAFQPSLTRGALFALSWVATATTFAQAINGDVLTTEWMQASHEQRASAIDSALRDASDKR